MAIGADERHGMTIDAEEKHCVASGSREMQHAPIDEIFKFKKQAELQKCFENYKPVDAVLCGPGYTIHDFSEIVTVMENLGFSLLDSSDDWRQFRFTKGLESINISKDILRLPFAKLEACHPCVYKCFLEDVRKWIGRELTSESLRIGLIPLSNEVKGWNGLFPTTWRKEKHRLWYKYDSLDTETKQRSLQYKWREEYMRDLTGCDQDKLEDREKELQNLITILNYEQGVREEWKRCKLVTLWDVQSSRVIRTYVQLNAFLEKIGFKPEELSHYVGYIEKTSAAGVTRHIFPEPPIRRFSWLYEDTTAQSYSYCPHRISKESFPWLPHPCMAGCHPLTYFLFLQKVEKCIGREATKKHIWRQGHSSWTDT